MNKPQKLLVAALSLSMLICPAFLYADDDDDDDEQFSFTAFATGAQEVPGPVDTDAHGRVRVQFDRGLTEARVKVNLRDLQSTVVAAHLHCNRAGLNGPPAFGLLNPGPLVEIDQRVDVVLTNDDAVADCTDVIGRPVSNIAALYFAMRDGLIYFNVHTVDYPPGELRGQLIQDD